MLYFAKKKNNNNIKVVPVKMCLRCTGVFAQLWAIEPSLQNVYFEMRIHDAIVCTLRIYNYTKYSATDEHF